MVCCELSEHLKQMEIDFNINIQFLNTLSQKLNIIQTNSLANLFSYSLSNDFLNKNNGVVDNNNSIILLFKLFHIILTAIQNNKFSSDLFLIRRYIRNSRKV